MAFHQGGSAGPAVGDARPFTMSPDSAFPPNRSSSGSSTTNSPRTPLSRNPTPSDEIERHRSCRAYSIDFYFPPADSVASSDFLVLSDSASSSPTAWRETLPEVGKHNHLPLSRFQGMSTRFKQGVQSTMMSSLVGTGLQTAFEILDALGSNIPNLYRGSGFFSNLSLKGNKVSILAFEIANTVIRGATFLNSLSEENLDFFEMEILFSTGVRTLVSNDPEQLLRIYASEKREELDRLSMKLVMFGNICKAPQWHHLDIYFSRLDSSDSHYKMPKDEAELTMNQLVVIAQYTLELYYSLQDLEKLEKEYVQKFHELEALNPSQRGELKLLQSELKAQRKHVRNLKKKSFWSRSLEEFMESLVDAFTYIHQSVMEVFGNNASRATCENLNGGPESLGKDGLALGYANIVKLIDKIASEPSAVSSKARDSLYDALPASVKTALRFRLRSRGAEEEHLSASEIKAEMNKTLEWLVPFASNTTMLGLTL